MAGGGDKHTSDYAVLIGPTRAELGVSLKQMIYKYRSFNTQYKYDVFTRSELYFAKPSEFNDPFESKPMISGLDTLKKRQEYVTNYIKREFPSVKYKDRQALNKKLLIRLANLDLITNNMHTLLDNYGIFSSSEKWDQCLMWSHYSDSHKGFCIGFDFDEEFDHDMGGAHKVKYSKYYPELTPEIFNSDSDGSNEKLFETTLATKSNDWSYEKEVRYIKLAREGGNGAYKFCETKVKEVIIGANATPSAKNEIIDIITKHMPWVNIYQAMISTSKYEIYRQEIKLTNSSSGTGNP